MSTAMQLVLACAAFAALLGLGLWKVTLDAKAFRDFATKHGLKVRDIDAPDHGLSLSGAWNGSPVVLELRSTKSLSDPEAARTSEARNKKTYAIFEIVAPEPGAELTLRRRHRMFEGLAKLEGDREVGTGIAEMDEAFAFRGRDEGAVRELLANPSRRDALLELLRGAERLVKHPIVHLDSRRLRLVHHGPIRDHAKLGELLELVTQCRAKLAAAAA